MTPELIEAIGEHIILPICFFGFLGFLVWMDKDERVQGD